MGQGHIQQNHAIENLIEHPNVVGRLIVQLSCEKGHAALIVGENRCIQVRDGETESKEAVPLITIQETGVTWKTVDRIVIHVEETLLPGQSLPQRADPG